jgi:quinol monooxygenase YgiN
VSVTVVSELRVQPGQEEAAVDVVLSRLALPSSTIVGRRFARLFQHLDDPTRLLYVAEWESREAHEALTRAMPLPGIPDQFVCPPTFRYFRPLTSFERMLVPIGIASAVIVDGPADTHLARRAAGLAYHQLVAHQRRGLVLLALYETTDPPPGLLMLVGWESLAAFRQAYEAAGPKLVDQLIGDDGVAHRFLGTVRAETTFG